MSVMLRLNLIAIGLAAVVVILGAYTRLTDAGLGCPDWPGCYGFLTVPEQSHELQQAEQAFPQRPVEVEKAWNEMIHRYFAGSLGLLIGAIWLFSLTLKRHRVLTSVLLVTVCFQAVLGMWTVTMNLMPLVVMGHLLGGFATFCLLVLLALTIRRNENQTKPEVPLFTVAPKMLLLSKLVMLILVGQIALGGWTAANYAAVVCTELPVCEGQWQSKFDFEQAFSIPTGHATYEYGVFSYEARMTIHIMHRVGALVTLLAVFSLAWLMVKTESVRTRQYGFALFALVSFQFALGITNVVFNLPLFIAVAHNFIALCLLATLLAVMVKFSAARQLSASFRGNNLQSQAHSQSSSLSI